MKSKKKTACFIEAIIAILILGVGLYLRMYFYAPYGEPVLGETIIPNAFNEYAQNAYVTGGGAGQFLFEEGIYSLYYLLIHGIFLLFGNIWSAGIVVQVVLSVLAFVVLYFATRKGSGNVAAIILLALCSFFPALITASLVYGPQMLYLLLSGVCLYVVNGFIEEGKKESNSLLKLAFLSVGVSVFLAVLIYLAIDGILLLPLVLLFPICCRRNGGVLPWIFISLLVLVLTAAGVCGLIFLQGAAYGEAFGFVLNEWIRTQALNLLNVIMGWGYFATLPLVMFYPISFACFLARMIKKRFYYTVDGSVDDLFNITFDDDETVQEDVVVVEDSVEEKVAEAEMTEAETTKEPEEKVNESVAETTAAQEAPVTETIFIENPLPLPKKHVKKRLEFAIEPSLEEMEYDFEVDENDTYDIE